MVASAENTARKYMEIRKALLRANRQITAREIHKKNAPIWNQVLSSVYNALENTQEEPMTLNHAIVYFSIVPPSRREPITSAYNKLPQLHRELNAVAHKIMAVRRIQPHWRKALQTARNKNDPLPFVRSTQQGPFQIRRVKS
jgi:hypothetical protein